MTRLAAIDIGTNSTKMTVADVGSAGHIKIFREDSEVTRLGEGVDRTRRVAESAMSRTLDVLERFAESARADGAINVIAVGTSALRDASNGAEFLESAKRRADVRVEVVTGDREAQLAFAAVQSDTALSQREGAPLLVFDIGGGSTELIFGNASGVERHQSLNIGAVRLTERLLKSDPPNDAEVAQASKMADQMLAEVSKPSANPIVIGLGGTVVNIAAVALQQAAPDSEILHGITLSVAQVRDALALFRSVPLTERRQIAGLEPKRADVIIAGALLLERLLSHFDVDSLIVSVRGLRYGLLADYARQLHRST